MKNQILTLIPLVLISAVAYAIAPPAVLPITPATEPAASVQLRYAILEAPPVMEATAEALGMGRIGFVRASLCFKWRPWRFDEDKAERNIVAISAICDGADIIVTDLEGEFRRRVRDPERYTKAQVTEAEDNFAAMRQWFKERWPKAQLSEWSLSARSWNRTHPNAEKMVIEHLDFIDVSLFWKPGVRWHDRRTAMLKHAVMLGREHEMPVMVWVQTRYTIRHDDGAKEYAPLAPEAIDEMVELALSEGVDIVVLWGHDYVILFAEPNADKYLSEMFGNDDAADVLAQVNAQIVLLMAKIRLHSEMIGVTNGAVLELPGSGGDTDELGGTNARSSPL